MEEQNGIETSNGGFDSPKKREILMPPPWVCYKLKLTSLCNCTCCCTVIRFGYQG
jgi:hypothetical protein